MKIKVKVKPSSKKNSLTLVEKDSYIAELKSPPEKNKANLELIKTISKFLKIPSKGIKIKSGLTSKEKILEIK